MSEPTREMFVLTTEVSVRRLFVSELQVETIDRSHLIGLGEEVDLPGLNAIINKHGILLPYFHSAFDVPLVSTSLGEAIARLSPGDVQLIPVAGLGRKFYAVNVLRVVDCVDESRSRFLTIGPEIRADRVGWYKYFSKLCLFEEAVPPEVGIFLVARWLGIVVTSRMKALMISTGCDGAIFTPVEQSRCNGP